MTRTHQVRREEFAALAVGAGDAAAIRSLRAAELSRRIHIVHMVRDLAASQQADSRLHACVEDAFALLVAADERSRTDVEDVLMHPAVGAWGVRCLRTLHAGRPGAATATAGSGDDVEDMLGYLTGVAVAAALRTGHPVDAGIRAVNGTMFLPTLGHVRLAGESPWARASVSAGTSRLCLDVPGEAAVQVDVGADAGDGWFPTRRLRSAADGCVLDVSLEDDDPYGDYGMPCVAGPLDAGGVAQWQAALDAGWSLLVRHHRRQAAAIEAGVTALVPLAGGVSGLQVSATCGDAFGAVALSTPADGLTLAAALVHEFQHAKLYALLHLVRLVEAMPGRTFYAPWRSDPRPLAGLLQGAYAFLGLVEFWHAQRSVGSPAARRRAAVEFARWREAVDGVLDTLAGSGALTASGKRFVAGMRERSSSWLRVPVEGAVTAEARAAAARHLAEWRSRHLEDTRSVEARS